MKDVLLLALGAVLLLASVLTGHASCGPKGAAFGPVIVDPPPPVPDSGAAADLCQRACDVLAAVHCAVGSNPLCAETCRTDQAQGVGAQLDPACIVDAGPTLALVNRCGIVCANGGP